MAVHEGIDPSATRRQRVMLASTPMDLKTNLSGRQDLNLRFPYGPLVSKTSALTKLSYDLTNLSQYKNRLSGLSRLR